MTVGVMTVGAMTVDVMTGDLSGCDDCVHIWGYVRV